MKVGSGDMLDETSCNMAHMGSTALVVDDDALVADFLSDTLGDMGFQVETAGTVAEALAIVGVHARFSVAFVDLGLPDRSGLELISELLALHPDLPVVIASGYGTMAKRDKAEGIANTDSSNLAILSKPYDAKVVARILDDLGIEKTRKM